MGLPIEAFNLSIEKIDNDKKLRINKTKIKIRHEGEIKDLDGYEIDKEIERINKKLSKAKDEKKKEKLQEKLNELNSKKQGKIRSFAVSSSGFTSDQEESNESNKTELKTDIIELIIIIGQNVVKNYLRS